MSMEDRVLECQDCGVVLRELTAAEAQQVSLRPYDFVVRCSQCQRDNGPRSM